MENKERTALVLGSHGQMGSYMMDLLKSKGYSVHGLPKPVSKNGLEASIALLEPDEIYNFAGYSHTLTPYAEIDKMIETNLILPQHLLHIISETSPTTRLFQASSCLVFGKDGSESQNENTPINPSHPYGIVKNTVDQLIRMYRQEKGLFVCSGILFPNESPRRKPEFFTKKIAMAVARIKMGSDEKIKLSSNHVYRDWTWSPDVVEAAWMMLQANTADDYVIGSGNLRSTEDFIRVSLLRAGFQNWRDYVEIDSSVVRDNDLNPLRADITKIKKNLGWEPTWGMADIAEKMVYYEIEQLKNKI